MPAHPTGLYMMSFRLYSDAGRTSILITLREALPNLLRTRYSCAMLSKYATPQVRTPWRLLLGVLCISLILVVGTLSVTHTHADGKVHSECSLCITAHLAVHVSAPPPQIFLSQVFTEFEAARPVARPQSAPLFALFSRPPPADANRS
jgi:hypothetical protein